MPRAVQAAGGPRGAPRSVAARVPVSGKQRAGGVAGCADAAGPIRGPAKPAKPPAARKVVRPRPQVCESRRPRGRTTARRRRPRRREREASGCIAELPGHVAGSGTRPGY